MSNQTTPPGLCPKCRLPKHHALADGYSWGLCECERGREEDPMLHVIMYHRAVIGDGAEVAYDTRPIAVTTSSERAEHKRNILEEEVVEARKRHDRWWEEYRRRGGLGVNNEEHRQIVIALIASFGHREPDSLRAYDRYTVETARDLDH